MADADGSVYVFIMSAAVADENSRFRRTEVEKLYGKDGSCSSMRSYDIHFVIGSYGLMTRQSCLAYEAWAASSTIFTDLMPSCCSFKT